MPSNTTNSVLKGLANPKRAMEIVGDKVLTVFGQKSYRPFVILSRARTGSTLLLSLLNSHAHVRAQGEIFEKLKGQDYRVLLSKTYSKQPYFVKAKGFKIFYYHPQDNHACGIWDALEADRKLHIIHLKRRNVLRTLLSLKIAKLTDRWMATSSQKPQPSSNPTVSFDKEELEAGFRQTRDWEVQGDARFKDHPLISMYYEELAANPDEMFAKVTDFLGIQRITPSTTLQKQGSSSLRDSIANYDELKQAFTGSEWSSFFEE